MACTCQELRSDNAGATDVVIQRDLRIPMRDGVKLAADVWLPSGKGPFPALIYRTPYDREAEAEYNRRTILNALNRGYVVLVSDVRGRYGSGGEFDPYVNEGRDGFDTVEWAASQSWSNGAIGMFGVSYPGAVQWLAALENPPHLRAIAPGMTFSSIRHFMYYGGIFDLGWMDWIHSHVMLSAQLRLGLRQEQSQEELDSWWQKNQDAFYGKLPLEKLGETHLQQVASFFLKWMNTPPEDASWDAWELGPKFAQTSAAVLNFSGWYDESYGPHGAIDAFCALSEARRSWPDPKTALVMGPWQHGAYEIEETKAGERQFAKDAALNYDELVLDWMDRYVKGESSAKVSAPAVRAYAMGQDEWITSQSWPIDGSNRQTLHLTMKDKQHGMLASAAPTADDSRPLLTISSDPKKPAIDERASGYGAVDLRTLVKNRGVATFETEPLNEPLRVLGAIHAEIVVSATIPDFDLFLVVQDVAPDGRALTLMSPGQGAMRARYRNGYKAPRTLPIGNNAILKFDRLLTGNTFLPGHRLRISLAPAWYPYFARNLQTGASEVIGSEMHKGLINIHRGSKLVLTTTSETQASPQAK